MPKRLHSCDREVGLRSMKPTMSATCAIRHRVRGPRLVELLQTYSARNGIDPLIGRKLPRLLREAGLIDVRVNPIIHVYPPGHGRRSLLLDFSENLSERLVAQKLVGEPELTGLKADLSRHLADPNTLVVSHLYFQSWGRKPGFGLPEVPRQD